MEHSHIGLTVITVRMPPVMRYLEDAPLRDRAIGQYLSQPHKLGIYLHYAKPEIWKLLRQIKDYGWQDVYVQWYQDDINAEVLQLLSIATPELAKAFLALRDEVLSEVAA